MMCDETLRFGGGPISYFLPYPFWPRVVPADKTSPLVAKFQSIVLPWASSLSLNEEKLKEAGLKATKLWATTEFGGTQSGSFSLAPDQELSQENLGERLMAVSLSGEGKGRLIVVGDSDFLADQVTRGVVENVAFGVEAVSWLAQEESLAGIRLKQRAAPPLMFRDATQVALVRYGNMSLAVLLPLAFGLWRYLRRKNLRKLSYTNLSSF